MALNFLRNFLGSLLLLGICSFAYGAGTVNLPDTYMSPGLQLGWEHGMGPFIGIQVSEGRWIRKVQAWGGATLGLRYGFKRGGLWLYGDGQSSWIVGGLGAGAVIATPDKSHSAFRIGPRWKAWAGAFVLGTFDVAYFSDEERPISVGAMGVLPIYRPKVFK